MFPASNTHGEGRDEHMVPGDGGETSARPSLASLPSQEQLLTQPGFLPSPPAASASNAEPVSEGIFGVPRDSGFRSANSMDSQASADGFGLGLINPPPPATTPSSQPVFGAQPDSVRKQLQDDFDDCVLNKEIEMQVKLDEIEAEFTERLATAKRKFDAELGEMEEKKKAARMEHTAFMRQVDDEYNERCRRHKIQIIRLQDEEAGFLQKAKDARACLDATKKEANKMAVKDQKFL